MKTIQHTAISYATTKARIGKSIVTPRQFFLVALALILVTAFFGCDLFGAKGVTIKERIDMFMKDVNEGNYGNLYTHFHPQDTQQRQEVAPKSFWTPLYFQSGTTYIYNVLISGEVATVTVSGGIYSSTPFTFTMAKSGDDYYIRKLEIPKGNVIVESYLLKN
jgi:hypothetical protein